MKSLSHARFFGTPWTIAHQAPPSMEFSRQEYWSGLPFPSPGDLPNPEIEPRSPTLWARALLSEPQLEQIASIFCDVSKDFQDLKPVTCKRWKLIYPLAFQGLGSYTHVIKYRLTNRSLRTCIPPVYTGDTQENSNSLKWSKPPL